MLAASGGPRWLGLVGIDRALLKFLEHSQSSTRLPLLGASSGAWRLAALCCDDSANTYEELICEYVEQRYVGSPTPDEISQVCRDYLDRLFTSPRVETILSNPKLQLNFTTAIMDREHPSKGQTILALSKGWLLNTAARRLLGKTFKRGLFSVLPHPSTSPLQPYWDDIPNVEIALSRENFNRAILATGSIPLLLEGESAIPGAPEGHHLDGGLVDYHFEIETARGPVLYPHFSSDPVPGWMDRFFPFRRITQQARANLCLILPSAEQLSRYPLQDYPCREDFHRLSNEARIKAWRATVKENHRMERELTACLEAGELVEMSQPLH